MNFSESTERAVRCRGGKAPNLKLGVDSSSPCWTCHFLVAMPAKGVEKSFPLLCLLDKILPIYKEVIAELKEASASWILFDEPVLVLDLDSKQLAAVTTTYFALESSLSRRIIIILFFVYVE